MVKRLILFATKQEANSSLRALASEEITPSLYLFSEGAVVISGIGPFQALGAVLLQARYYEEIWNFGVAGAVDPTLPSDAFFTIQSVQRIPTKEDERNQSFFDRLYPPLPLGDKGKRLLTSDLPLHSASLRNTLQGDLLDMEGYGVAYGARLLAKPLFIWKLVSDHCEEGGWKKISDRMELYSDLLASKVVELLESAR